MPQPSEIVRCLKRDMSGDLECCARYAEKFSKSSTYDQAHNYATAAMILREEIARRESESLTFDGEASFTEERI